MIIRDGMGRLIRDCSSKVERYPEEVGDGGASPSDPTIGVQLKRLERAVDNRKVKGSMPFMPTKVQCGVFV